MKMKKIQIKYIAIIWKAKIKKYQIIKKIILYMKLSKICLIKIKIIMMLAMI